MRWTNPEKEKTEMNLAEAVWTALEAEDRITSKKIRITADNGTVTLHGEVDNLEEYGLAQDVAESVIGVRAVANHLTIKGEVDTGPCCP